ncbi:IS5 family transposase ISNGR9 [Candidatus Magnetaquicoccaceae bacterium FCR-1]|uniref:IS5 family transposase ISNGR9 n=1 Tax=Candidatus Magnetaquiglobus chichijimensis TaxID=3141448 RepID=A0ABQ0C7M3_9PROT
MLLGLKKNGPQAIGRSRGGLTTKIHAAVDALGNPLKYLLTGGQEADITQAHALIEGLDPELVIADKGYDANHFVETIEARGAEPVIPPRSNRLTPREYDKYWYKDRNLVERFFNRIKQFRRVATRYEKLDKCFGAMIGFWLAQ